MSDILDIGDEVICNDAAKPEGWSIDVFPQWVVKDVKYIIREILRNDNIVIGVLLVELKNPTVYQELIKRPQEAAFSSWRFSKLRSRYQIQEEEESATMDVEYTDELVEHAKEEV